MYVLDGMEEVREGSSKDTTLKLSSKTTERANLGMNWEKKPQAKALSKNVLACVIQKAS